MTKGDKLLLAGLLLISLLSIGLLYSRFPLFSRSNAAAQVVISVRGEVVQRASLPVETRTALTVQGRVGPSIVEITGSRVRMLDAPCTGRICVNQGWIGHSGQSIVCMPGEILIRIEGASPVDGVTR